jgi:hypothetical protein
MQGLPGAHRVEDLDRQFRVRLLRRRYRWMHVLSLLVRQFIQGAEGFTDFDLFLLWQQFERLCARLIEARMSVCPFESQLADEQIAHNSEQPSLHA